MGEMFIIFSSLAQFERRFVQNRTIANFAAAPARGRLGGRKPIRPDDLRVVGAKQLNQDRNLSVESVRSWGFRGRPFAAAALTDAAAGTHKGSP